MAKIIGVRFRTAGKIYFFDPLDYEIKRGDNVIVETARGIEFGTVVSGVREVADDSLTQPVKPVLRIANERDHEQAAANKLKEREAFKICLEKIEKHNLEMKLIDAEYTFDNNKVLFYFTADGRVDFRELVKDLASVFRTRIELRQIGVRDETKIRGGIGICGRPLCCHTYLSDFIPVSIKMAKEQNLSLNPTKISGVCGRLMCCLKNEEETYEELNRRLPGIGDHVLAEDGTRGTVQSVSVLRQRVKVVVDQGDSKEVREYDVKELHFKRRHTKKERMEFTPEQLQELERLESEEISGVSSIDDNVLEQQEDNPVGSVGIGGFGHTFGGEQSRTERGDRREGRRSGGRNGRDRGERSGYGERRERSGRPRTNDRNGRPERYVRGENEYPADGEQKAENQRQRKQNGGRRQGGKNEYRSRDRRNDRRSYEDRRDGQQDYENRREGGSGYRKNRNPRRYNRHDNRQDAGNNAEE